MDAVSLKKSSSVGGGVKIKVPPHSLFFFFSGIALRKDLHLLIQTVL